MEACKLAVLSLLMVGVVSCPECPGKPSGGSGARGRTSLVVLGDSIHSLALHPDVDPDMTDRFLELRPSSPSPLSFIDLSQLGATSSHGVSNIVSCLIGHADAGYFALAYGRNDHDTIGAAAFEANMRFMIKVVLSRKRIPILPSIAWSPESAAGTAPLDAILRKLSAEFGVPRGPDLRAWFEAHPEELGADLHPNALGKVSIQRLWAEMMSAYLPHP